MKVATACPVCGSSALKKVPAVLAPFVAHRVFGWEPIEITREWGFRDILPGHAYSLCTTCLCDQCTFLFLDIRFDDEEMGRLYEGYRDKAYEELRTRYEPAYASLNQSLTGDVRCHDTDDVDNFILRTVRVPRTILDWGGDSGKNTPLRSRVLNHYVYDISGAAVIEGAVSLPEEELPTRDYDLIVLSSVLEHVPYPSAILDGVVSLMSRDTVLYLELPLEELVRASGDIRTDFARKRLWHEHINFFSQDSVLSLLERAGLRAIDSTILPVSIGTGAKYVQSYLATRNQSLSRDSNRTG